MRRLILCLDGTWNSPEDNTNPWRIDCAVASQDADGNIQKAYYDEGVGTHWHDWFTGGALGRGLAKNIQQAYQWLMEYYEEGDELYIFGFSRGAYTARSLVGFLSKCGLLRSDTMKSMAEAFDFYRKSDVSSTSEEAQNWRRENSIEIRVKYLGVWDTVGAMGIPFWKIPFGIGAYHFHDTELSRIVDHAYHALAIDEHRKLFQPTLWTKVPNGVKEVEQRWFVGAHANVGGGYTNDPLSLLSLKWLHEKARSAGLRFRGEIRIPSAAHLSPIRDSYREFMFRLYSIVSSRYYRPIGNSVFETLDPSVDQRRDQDTSYKPKNLMSYSNQKIS